MWLCENVFFCQTTMPSSVLGDSSSSKCSSRHTSTHILSPAKAISTSDSGSHRCSPRMFPDWNCKFGTNNQSLRMIPSLRRCCTSTVCWGLYIGRSLTRTIIIIYPPIHPLLMVRKTSSSSTLISSEASAHSIPVGHSHNDPHQEPSLSSRYTERLPLPARALRALANSHSSRTKDGDSVTHNHTFNSFKRHCFLLRDISCVQRMNENPFLSCDAGFLFFICNDKRTSWFNTFSLSQNHRCTQ